VSIVRILLRLSAFSAIRNVMRIDMAVSGHGRENEPGFMLSVFSFPVEVSAHTRIPTRRRTELKTANRKL